MLMTWKCRVHSARIVLFLSVYAVPAMSGMRRDSGLSSISAVFLAFSLFSFHFFTFVVVSTNRPPHPPCLPLAFTNPTPIPISQLLRSLSIYDSIGCPGLGHRYSISDKNQDKEIQRRITAGWITFAKHRDIFKGNIGACLKRQVYNSCVLPAMTYGAEKCMTLTT